MFVKSSESEQLNLFSCASSSFSGKALSGYENELGWHNLFRKNATMNIKEELFNVLYSSGTGAPNASIRIMLAMMILKEAQGLSDAKIFEEGRYNALTRSALGILNWDDISSKSIQSPHDTEATYRNKDGNQVRGNAINITETCNDTGLNLIVNADGAYNSPVNQTFCEQNKINLTLHAIQGKKSDYELIVTKSGEVSVFHRENKQDMKAMKTESKDGRIRWLNDFSEWAHVYIHSKQ